MKRTRELGWFDGFLALLVLLLALLGVLLAFASCASFGGSQFKPTSNPGMVPPGATGGGWWNAIAGLGVLNWGGGILIVLGGIAFVGTFVPVVGSIFPKKMSVSCVAAGIASILLYNFLTAYLWVVYIVLGLGAVALALTYWPSIKALAVQVHELWSRRDEDKDGTIGPKFG